MTDFTDEIRLVARSLVREPGFSLAAVITVAVGVGTTVSVYALVDGVLVRPLPYPNPDRLVSVRPVAPGTDLSANVANLLLTRTHGRRGRDRYHACTRGERAQRRPQPD